MTDLSRMNDYEKLLLIDRIIDSLADEGAGDELAEGLGAAFERVEQAFPSGPIYPFGNCNPAVWAAWRITRDARLAMAGAA